MIVTACAMAFAHGSNDVANAIGPIAAIVSIVSSDGTIQSSSELNSWVLLLGAVGIVFGLAIMGRHVIKTVGEKITTLTPSLGFSQIWLQHQQFLPHLIWAFQYPLHTL